MADRRSMDGGRAVSALMDWSVARLRTEWGRGQKGTCRIRGIPSKGNNSKTHCMSTSQVFEETKQFWLHVLLLPCFGAFIHITWSLSGDLVTSAKEVLFSPLPVYLWIRKITQKRRDEPIQFWYRFGLGGRARIFFTFFNISMSCLFISVCNLVQIYIKILIVWLLMWFKVCVLMQWRQLSWKCRWYNNLV